MGAAGPRGPTGPPGSLAASGDDPGAGVEPDTVAARVRGEHLAQAPQCARRGGGIQPVEYVLGCRRSRGPSPGRRTQRCQRRVHCLPGLGARPHRSSARSRTRCPGHARRAGRHTPGGVPHCAAAVRRRSQWDRPGPSRIAPTLLTHSKPGFMALPLRRGPAYPEIGGFPGREAAPLP